MCNYLASDHRDLLHQQRTGCSLLFCVLQKKRKIKRTSNTFFFLENLNLSDYVPFSDCFDDDDVQDCKHSFQASKGRRKSNQRFHVRIRLVGNDRRGFWFRFSSSWWTMKCGYKKLSKVWEAKMNKPSFFSMGKSSVNSFENRFSSLQKRADLIWFQKRTMAITSWVLYSTDLTNDN